MEFKNQYGIYERVGSGKVREVYEDKLNGKILLVATDRVSAFDRTLKVEIPDKGKILTAISAEMCTIAEQEWGIPTAYIYANVKPANEGGLYIETDLDYALAGPDGEVPTELKGRVTEMEKLEMFGVECIVRGHISGSAWKLYEAGEREICGVPLPEGLKNGSKLPKPIFTPTTKAPEGQHDENITFGEMADIVKDWDMAGEIFCYCTKLYELAYEFFLERGVILADTKFELGMDDYGNVVFGDEILTPDSSRYWDAKTFVPGQEPMSFDKQIVRDYLADAKARGEDVLTLPAGIIDRTRRRYEELFEKVTGYPWPEG